jgi:hypothetical protein
MKEQIFFVISFTIFTGTLIRVSIIKQKNIYT